ncbi:hypothetical protein [Hathewaya proteolytica]|uniref:hypothetical protein n=1 Tax=Hathewaya proteolytica TaxID=29365 RepID=UPI0015C0F468|nr:hypothetical protein [Hathewaya proteolytica]
MAKDRLLQESKAINSKEELLTEEVKDISTISSFSFKPYNRDTAYYNSSNRLPTWTSAA